MKPWFHLTSSVRKMLRQSIQGITYLKVESNWMELSHTSLGCPVEAPDGVLVVIEQQWRQIISLQEQNDWDLIVIAMCRDNVLSLQVLSPSASQPPVFTLSKRLGVTCSNCSERQRYEFADDPYSTDGDCLAEK